MFCGQINHIFAASRKDEYPNLSAKDEQQDLILHNLDLCGAIERMYVCLTRQPTANICLLLKMFNVSWMAESDHDYHELLSNWNRKLLVFEWDVSKK